MFYVVIGFREEGRKNPLPLWIGSNRGEIQTAVDGAPADIVRIEVGFFDFHTIGRRTPGSKPVEAFVGAPTLEEGMKMLEEIDRLDDEIEKLKSLLSDRVARVMELEAAVLRAAAPPAAPEVAPTLVAAETAQGAAAGAGAPAAESPDAGPQLDLSAETLAESDTAPANGGKGSPKKKP